MKKKIFSYIALFSILLTSFWNSVYALTQYNWVAVYSWTSSYKQVSKWISEATLKELIFNKWLTKAGLTYLLKQKNISSRELKNLKNATKKQKLDLLRRLYKWWLNEKQLNYLKTNKWLTKSWLKLVWGINLVFDKANLIWSYKVTNTWNFLEDFQGQDWVYKVNFKNITPNNAAEVQRVFKWEDQFPKKLVLPEGFVYEVKTNDLSKEFVKTNSLLTKVNNLKSNWIDIWKLKISEPILQVLPDRIQYIKNVEISFSSEKQLDNIKSNLSEEFNLSTVNINNLKAELVNNKENNNLKEWLSSKQLRVANKNITNQEARNKLSQIWKLWLLDWIWNRNVLDATNDDDIYEDLVNQCKIHYWANSNNCSLEKIKWAEKTLTLQDKVEYSLIPTTLEDIKLWKILIKKDPLLNSADFNLTTNEIYSRFIDLREMKFANMLEQNPYASNWETAKHDIEAENYCWILYWTWTTEYTDCKELQDKMNEVTTATYSKKLLNGFTLWESKNYHWGTSLSVNLVFSKVKVFEIWFDFYYSYGFWIRIPIEVTWEITDNIINDYKAENTIFTGSIKVETFDWDEDFFNDIITTDWSDNSKAFRWKEYVFEVTAWAKLHVWVKYIWSLDIDIPFISLLAWILWNDLLDSLWLEDDDIKNLGLKLWGNKVETKADLLNYIIDTNGIDQSKDFKAPFAWDNTIQLFRFLTPEIPLYNNGVIKLLWKLWVKSKMDWRITVKCEWYNTIWGCPNWDPASSVWTTESSINIWADSSRVHLDSKEYYISHGSAVYNPSIKESDILGSFSKFWLKFSDFRYHPILIFTIFAKAWLWAKIPLWVGWKTYWTPDIDLYTFKFSSDDFYLGQHAWTDWDFNMIDNNVIYSTESTLKDINEIKVSEIWWKYLPRSILSIKPESNTKWANRTFFRTDWIMPFKNFWTCWTFEEEWTYNYTNPQQIWPNAKNELVNQRIFDLYAKSCDLLIKWKQGSERIKKMNNKIIVKNYYHKVLASWGKDVYIENEDVLSGLKQEELDRVNVDANLLCNANFGLFWYEENKPYYIMYNLVSNNIDKTVKTRNKVNLYSNDDYYKYEVPEEINYPSCDGNIWQKYNWERFMFVKNKNEYYWDKTNLVLIDQNITLYAVKCIWKSNPSDRWEVFTSLNTIFDINVAAWWMCEDQKDDLQHGDLWWIKDKIDGVIWIDDIKWWDYWNNMLWNVWWQVMWINWEYNFNWEYSFKNYWLKDWQWNYTWWPTTMWFDWWKTKPIKDTSSDDEYINSKLDEINDCFIKSYENHLKTINDAINKFKTTKDNSSNEKTKNKYQKAIDKLNEIKRLFINRYNFILNYKNWIFNNVNNNDTNNNLIEWITKTSDDYYIVDSDKVEEWCNSDLVPDKDKCILKINSYYVEPKEGLYQSAWSAWPHGSQTYTYCDKLSNNNIGWFNNWDIANLTILSGIYNNKSKLNILSNRYYGGKNKNRWSIHMRDWSRSSRYSYFTVCIAR